jgi:hypothetical protein
MILSCAVWLIEILISGAAILALSIACLKVSTLFGLSSRFRFSCAKIALVLTAVSPIWSLFLSPSLRIQRHSLLFFNAAKYPLFTMLSEWLVLAALVSYGVLFLKRVLGLVKATMRARTILAEAECLNVPDSHLVVYS